MFTKILIIFSFMFIMGIGPTLLSYLGVPKGLADNIVFMLSVLVPLYFFNEFYVKKHPENKFNKFLVYALAFIAIFMFILSLISPTA